MWFCTRSSLTRVTKFSKSTCLACSFSDISCGKNKSAPLQERRMIDRFRVCAKGGEGGHGCSSFRRSRRDHRGKPDGGNGGRGGDVILECSAAVWDFSSLQHHINAKRGGNGAPKNMIGTRGLDKVVLVPVGTVIQLLEGEISSSVEKKTYGVLDPWDIPGTLDIGSSESSQLSQMAHGWNSQRPVVMDETSAHSSEETFKRPCRASQRESFPTYSTSIGRNPGQSNTHNIHSTQVYNELTDSDGEMDLLDPESGEDMTDGEEMLYNVAELTEPGQQVVVARGGEGGLGNAHFSAKDAKPSTDVDSNTEASSSVHHTQPNTGLPGSEVVLQLELKSIADVALIGMPNAGKSTLLGAISRAKPAVGHYAFTTLRPNLGKLNYDDISITVADIPGLVRGAHVNRGLGHAFLRHIERTRVLAYVIDLAAALDGRKGIPPWEQLKELLLELEFYCRGLSGRPSVVVANKIDEDGAEAVFRELKRRVKGIPIFPVCAVLEQGVTELKSGLKMLAKGEDLSTLKIDNIDID